MFALWKVPAAVTSGKVPDAAGLTLDRFLLRLRYLRQRQPRQARMRSAKTTPTGTPTRNASFEVTDFEVVEEAVEVVVAAEPATGEDVPEDAAAEEADVRLGFPEKPVGTLVALATVM